ncbi:uncharacterized protein Tco025E_06777 [Trypanosoma conorhini]|uniref:Uncharacterized protein n=1 Tax=Trypanosoma conorhini TaxID=83891 RepID=A0A3R7MSH1_9TRYP|nr:uncharacterized protein Tco025E_06777 [Trypanosoma conorhini]RNF10520.1 hypothetical protein Tco025E_06777 [Trypanosoma conorhini]
MLCRNLQWQEGAEHIRLLPIRKEEEEEGRRRSARHDANTQSAQHVVWDTRTPRGDVLPRDAPRRTAVLFKAITPQRSSARAGTNAFGQTLGECQQGRKKKNGSCFRLHERGVGGRAAAHNNRVSPRPRRGNRRAPVARTLSIRPARSACNDRGTTNRRELRPKWGACKPHCLPHRRRNRATTIRRRRCDSVHP